MASVVIRMSKFLRLNLPPRLNPRINQVKQKARTKRLKYGSFMPAHSNPHEKARHEGRAALVI
jgi:hypothetical protein